MRQLRLDDSSNISAATVDEDAEGQYIDVEFKSGSTYRYRGVTTRDFTELCSAASVGSWVQHQLVKKPQEHPVRRVDPTRRDHPTASDRLRTALQLIASPSPEWNPIDAATMQDIARDALSPEQPMTWPTSFEMPVVEVDRNIRWDFSCHPFAVFTPDEAEAIGLALIACAREARRCG